MTDSHDTEAAAAEIGERFVKIPIEALSRVALNGLVEEYVTRDGTDYGLEERTLHAKKSALIGQLESGEAVVVFDAETETANILSKDAIAMLVSDIEQRLR
jgi:uncharacterized protein YheU (UPF0270 family)